MNRDEKLTRVLKHTDYEEAIVIGSIFGELQQENTQLKSELQALRELLQEIEAQNQFCTICGTWEGHKARCVLKAELDQLKGVE